jgi:hypothetical protein
MIKITTLPAIAAALLAFGLAAAPAQAGPNRTFVSGTGSDSGACTRAAPCRTFAFAITVTNAGGEIDVLDPAGYGPVTINHAISIVNDGVGVAGITAGSGNAITINAGAFDSVNLRGLTIAGIGFASFGILFNSGGNLAIENCVIRNFPSTGIEISPSAFSSFSVSNTIVSNNGGSGINIQPTGTGGAEGVLSKVTANNNNSLGIYVNGASTTGASLKVTIVDSEASNNFSGVMAATSSGHAAIAVMLRNIIASYNSFIGLDVGQYVVLRIAHSVVTGNNIGVNGPGILNSYGDNDIDGNTNNNTGILTVIPTH